MCQIAESRLVEVLCAKNLILLIEIESYEPADSQRICDISVDKVLSRNPRSHTRSFCEYGLMGAASSSTVTRKPLPPLSNSPFHGRNVSGTAERCSRAIGTAFSPCLRSKVTCQRFLHDRFVCLSPTRTSTPYWPSPAAKPPLKSISSLSLSIRVVPRMTSGIAATL